MSDARVPPTDATPAVRLPVLAAIARFLTFRADRETLAALDGRHLAAGLAATWLVGVGRWWDDPAATPLQKSGLGSVAYVFALTTILWLVLLPLRPEALSWRRVLTVVTLTAPPAAIYAIPVERWTTVEAAISVNRWFLAVVAAWRVALVVVWMRRSLRLRWQALVAALLLPIAAIAWTLAELNPERAVGRVFDLMGGVRAERTPGDGAYELIQSLACITTVLLLPVLIAYVFDVLLATARARKAAAHARAGGSAPPQ